MMKLPIIACPEPGRRGTFASSPPQRGGEDRGEGDRRSCIPHPCPLPKERVCAPIIYLLLALSSSAQTFYAITDLGPGRAYAINESGHVAGETALRNGELHAFLWTPDGLTDLSTLGGRTSRAYDINANDWIVGEAEDVTGASFACLWRHGSPTNLAEGGTIHAINDAGAMAGVVNERAIYWPGPDATPTPVTAAGAIGIAFDLDPSDHIVGQGEMGDPAGRVSRAFVFMGGVAAGLADLGRGLSSSAQAINAPGQIAGFFESIRGQTHAFIFDGNGLRDLDTLNNAYSSAYGLNNLGDAVGVMFSSPNDDDQAFISSGGQMYNLNDLLDTREDWMLVEAWDINTAGQIVGYGIKDGGEHAYLLSPLESASGKLPRVRVEEMARGTPYVEPASIALAADVRSEIAIKRVTFYANGEIIGSATAAPFRLTWSDAPAGDFDLVARAFDLRGQMGVSPRVRVTVEVSDPAPAAEPAEYTPEIEPEYPPGADAP